MAIDDLNNPPSIGSYHESLTLKTKLVPDLKSTITLRNVKLDDDDTQPFLVSPDETVGTISAIDLAVVIKEEDACFAKMANVDLDDLVWYAKFKSFDILIGDQEETATRVGVVGYSVSGNEIKFNTYHYNERVTERGGPGILPGTMREQETGAFLSHRRFAQDAPNDIRNLDVLSIPSDQILIIVIQNSYLGKNKIG